MAYLEVNELSKTWGEITLFHKISFVINQGEKVALIARNGTGKSTLFRILKGIDVYDEGKFLFHKDIVLAFLDQEPDFHAFNTVWDACYHSDNPVIRVVREYEEAMQQQDMKRIETLSIQMDQLQAWDMEASIKQILTVFRISDLDKPIATLSGGQRKRLALANTLINKPDFLVLDEPTNHLDVDMIEWLEEYLNRQSITLLMVTHDRYFLDNVCDKILEIDRGEMFVYQGNYGYFLEKREARIETKNAEISKAKNLFRSELEWIRRMPKARSHKAKYRVDAFEQTKQKASQQTSQQCINIVADSARLGKKILDIQGISKSFDELLFSDLSYTFKRGEKIGIIGPNGSGKSTFLRIITGELQADSGFVETGETIKLGHYKQDGLRFDEQVKVIEIVKEIAEIVTLSNGRTISVSEYLRQWLFPDALHYVPFGSLSGGEKRRLYLLSLLMQSPNFLILDEPTNDLDLVTLQILEDYLASFAGCVIVVSHDRFFMDKIVDQLLIFDETPTVSIFPGNYTQYRDHTKDQLQGKKDFEKQQSKEKESSAKVIPKDKANKLTYKERLELAELEKAMAAKECEKKEVEAMLGDSAQSADELRQLSVQYEEMMRLLDEMENRWLELSEKDN